MRAREQTKRPPEISGGLMYLWTRISSDAGSIGARGGALTRRSVFVQLADVMLRVEFNAELADEIELRLEEVDVPLLVRHQFLEQIAARIVLHRVAVRRGLLI